MPATPQTPSLWDDLEPIDVADIVVDVDAPDLQPAYTYRVPAEMRSEIAVGTCVHVPFGGQEKVGYVFDSRSMDDGDPLAGRLRNIIATVRGAVSFTVQQAVIARWVSDRFVCDLPAAVRLIAPAVMTTKIVTRVSLGDPGLTPEAAGKSPVQAAVLCALIRLGGEAALDELRAAVQASSFSAAYSALLRKSLITESREVARARTVNRTIRAYDLTANKDAVRERLSGAGKRILSVVGELQSRGETPVLPEKLLRLAQASQSALKTLIEKGLVCAVELKVRRRAIEIPPNRTAAPILTPGQKAAAEWLARAIESTDPSDITHHASRTTDHGSRLTDDASRIMDHASGEVIAKVRELSSRGTRDLLLTDEYGSKPRRKTDPSYLGMTAGSFRESFAIASGITDHASRVALLFGVTASGKTEVYLDAIARTLDSGRGAIVLVPEIALTQQVVEIFSGRFGDEVAVLHSRLSDGEKHDEWRRLQDRQARVVVGARSAVFAPVDTIGLIVVDEEHEASYKQDSLPRYHARDVALERARLSGATVLLGSATPSLETYYATETGNIARLEMPERIDNRPLPAISLIDLREEMREHRSLFSRHLIERIGETLSAGRQTILFLNRRGYSQFVLCRDCGYVARCPNCAVSLTFHSSWGSLRCHHCDYQRGAPAICPSCSGTKIRGFGIGTERVEEEALKHFPNARIARMDRDTTSRKGAHASILGRFRRGEADILIGTQMVAKGLDFPNVTLVGVISADTSINMPDFRAAERTFQLMTQVAGRSGRGTDPGEVVIQSFCPEHYSLEMVVRQDYRGFYDREIEFRRELAYPPFSRLANLVCSHDSSDSAREATQTLAETLQKVIPSGIQVIGPAPCPLARLKSQYRWHVVLRSPIDEPLSDWIRDSVARLAPGIRRHLTIDIDPTSLA